MKLSIIIVNWNSGMLLSNAVESINKSYVEGLVIETIVIDNASTDGSIVQISENENVLIIKNIQNIGFGAACNQGYEYCKESDFILLLNPDVELFAHTLEQSLKILLEEKAIDILGVCHVNEDGEIKPSCSRFVTPLYLTYDVIGLSKLLPKFFYPGTVMVDWSHDYSRRVNQVMGAFMLIKRHVIDKIGFMDESFFVYFEDMDFCKRAIDMGFSVYYCSEIKIFHKGMGTTESIKDKRLLYSINSRLIYMKKHFSEYTYIYSLFLSLFVEPFFRVMFQILKLNINGVKETLSAYNMLYKKRLFNK